jgi:hypothetical protein
MLYVVKYSLHLEHYIALELIFTCPLSGKIDLMHTLMIYLKVQLYCIIFHLLPENKFSFALENGTKWKSHFS